jgi:small conductance mechanosensitive channel
MKRFFSLLLSPRTQFTFLVISIIFVFSSTQSASTQPETIPSQSSNQTLETSEKGLYFADVLVRGRPIFQIGSLPSLNARERAEIINRRIA